MSGGAPMMALLPMSECAAEGAPGTAPRRAAGRRGARMPGAARAPCPGQAGCRLGGGDQPSRDTEADHGRHGGAEGGSARLDAALVPQPRLHHTAATVWVRRPQGPLTTLPYPVPPVQHLCKARSCAPTHACAALHLAAGCRGGLQHVARAGRVASPPTGEARGNTEGSDAARPSPRVAYILEPRPRQALGLLAPYATVR